MADQSNSTAVPSSPDRNKKKRIRNWTADDRAAHRVFERSRREAFKERLTVSLDSVSLVCPANVDVDTCEPHSVASIYGS